MRAKITGDCDKCGMYAENLTHYDNKWLCKQCLRDVLSQNRAKWIPDAYKEFQRFIDIFEH